MVVSGTTLTPILLTYSVTRQFTRSTQDAIVSGSGPQASTWPSASTVAFHSFPCSQIALSVQLISLNIGLADLQHLGREQALTGVQTQMKPDVPIIRYST